MRCASLDSFREKGAKNKKKKVWEPLNFMEKMGKKNHSRLFCHLSTSKSL
jgi:hypothetical protein